MTLGTVTKDTSQRYIYVNYIFTINLKSFFYGL